jgi:hypothetical protein
LTLLDIAVVLWPLVGTLLIIAFGRYDSRKMRAENARAREAERTLQQQTPHATR